MNKIIKLIDKYLYLNEDKDVCIRDNASVEEKEILTEFIDAYCYFHSDDCLLKMNEEFNNTYKNKKPTD